MPTELSERDWIRCKCCDSEIREWKYTLKYGEWDELSQNFSGDPQTEHYCKDCFRKTHRNEKAARFEITDNGKMLWNVLDASNGQLVADLLPVVVGTRPFFRVKGGELEAIISKLKRDNYNNVIKSHMEQVRLPRERFDNLFETRDGDRPVFVYLKPLDETPFETLPYGPRDPKQRLFDQYI